MSKYHVYVDQQLRSEAIREGFSWPGFLLTWIWAFDKRLWRTGLGLMVLQFGLIGLVHAGRVLDAPRWIIAAVLVDLLSRTFVGLQGSYWRENSMDRRRFTFEATVQAQTAAAAIERTLQGGAAARALAREAPAWRLPRGLPVAVAAAVLLAILAAVWSGLRQPEPAAPRPAIESAVTEPVPVESAEKVVISTPAQFGEQRPAPSLPRSQPDVASNRALPASAAPVTVTADRPVAAATPARPAVANPSKDTSGPSMPLPTGRDAGGDRSPAAMEAAWNNYFKQSANCVEPADWDVYVECTNQKILAREAFEQKWSAGQLH